MADKGPSPEEQLLNLIEKGDGTKAKKPKKKSSFTSGILGKIFSPFNRVGSLLKKVKGKLIGEPSLELINKIVIILCVLIIGYSLMDFIFNRKDIQKFYNMVSSVKRIKEEEKEIITLRPFLHYLAIVKRRNIFSPIEIVKESDIIDEKKKTMQSLLSDLVLVGIAWGKEPQAMIESKEQEQTYFLNKGEMINSLKVERILRNKVILSYEGEEGELI